VLVARRITALRSASWQATVIRAAFSFSAGEGSGVEVLRRGGRLVELAEREMLRKPVCESMSTVARRDNAAGGQANWPAGRRLG